MDMLLDHIARCFVMGLLSVPQSAAQACLKASQGGCDVFSHASTCLSNEGFVESVQLNAGQTFSTSTL